MTNALAADIINLFACTIYATNSIQESYSKLSNEELIETRILLTNMTRKSKPT
eukprot:UN20455